MLQFLIPLLHVQLHLRLHRLHTVQAEAEYWKGKEGYERGWSDWLLGFDCGGQQWVLETAFPCGTVE